MNSFKGVCILLILLCSSAGFSQEVMYEEETPMLLRKEMSIGVTFHTGGTGLIYRRGVHVTGTTKRMLEVEAVTMKHPKEIKTKYNEDSKPYVFGKLNSLLLLRTGIGFQHVLYRKGDRTGLEIRINYSAGISLGIAKPVFLYIMYNKHGDRDSTVVEQYNPEKHNYNDIQGKAEFHYGLPYITLHPGGYGKAGFSFEFGRSDRSVRSLEGGAVLDIYPKSIPIMAYTKNNPYYLSLYISLLFGGKW